MIIKFKNKIDDIELLQGNNIRDILIDDYYKKKYRISNGSVLLILNLDKYL